MSSHVTTTRPPTPVTTPVVAPSGHRFGLPTATALVVGSVIGTGVFALPSALAVYGPISLVAFILVTVGAMALALTLGTLFKRVPGSNHDTIMASITNRLLVLPEETIVRTGHGDSTTIADEARGLVG